MPDEPNRVDQDCQNWGAEVSWRNDIVEGPLGLPLHPAIDLLARMIEIGIKMPPE